MPHSVTTSKFMIPRGEWPQIPADADVRSAITLLGIAGEDEALHFRGPMCSSCATHN
jgi:hypothetical protein